MNWLSQALRFNFISPINPATNLVIPAKQVADLRELDLPPRRRGIQSLKHSGRFVFV